MELLSVRFKTAVHVGPGGSAVTELDGVAVCCSIDYAARVVRVGRRFVPFENVLEGLEGEDRPECPECGQSFRSPSALGAHRRYKHKVRGARA